MESAQQLLHKERSNSWDSALWKRGVAVKDGSVLVRLARDVSSPPPVQGLGAAGEAKPEPEDSGVSRYGYLHC